MAVLLVTKPLAVLAATGARLDLCTLGAPYMQVRGLAAPAVLIALVLNSGLLAQKDSKTAFKAIVLSIVFNVIGDILLIRVFNLGLLGTAIATTAGVWLSVVCTVCLGYGPHRRVRIRWRPPRGEFWSSFCGAAAPLMLFSATTSFGWAVFQASATTLDVLSCAAHQAVWAVWSVFTMVTYPLSQAAQVFLTEDLSLRRGRRSALRLVRLILGIALTWGCALALICGALLTVVPSALVRDAQLLPLMKAIAPHACMSLVLAGSVQVLEGVMMAIGDTRCLAAAQLCSTVVIAGFLRIAMKRGSGIADLWPAVTLFYGVRAVMHALRLSVRGLGATAAG